MVKNPPANAGDMRDVGSIPGLGRSPGGGHSNPLQSSCLEIPMDGGTWRAIVHRIAKSRIQLKRLCTHTHTHTHALFRHERMVISTILDVELFSISLSSPLSYSDSLKDSGDCPCLFYS